MSLSWNEIVSIAFGLGGGYWLVSRIIERRDEPGGRPDDMPPPQETRQPWWEILDVPRIATRDEVARAYKRKISEYHPDKVARMGDEIRAMAERKSKEINSAYDEAMRGF